MAKDIPVISKLLRAMVLGDYKDALDIVLDEKFNPNEKTQSWGSPILSALITIMSGTKHSPFTKDAKDVFKAIVLHENFDPNATDAENETSLMHIARFSEYGWLVPFILNKKNVNIGLRNLMGRTAIDIASVHNNVAVRDLLMACNVKEVAIHSPKKKVGLKKKKATPAPTTNAEVTVSGLVANNIEVAFTPEAKENPFSLYHLVKNFINGNYDECLRIANNVHFNPNESDRWDEPALSSLIYYSQDSTVKYDEDKLKEIAKVIINNRTFDVNALDADCNTPLMVAMSFPKLAWLVKELFKISSARIDVVNDMGENLSTIAEKCGNSELYSDMIRRNYQTADVVS